MPGCEELIEHFDTELKAKVTSKIGPVKTRFFGSGGAAGFARGGTDVELAEDGDETILKYQAKVAVDGKLAQLGSRLVTGASRKLVTKFFASFAKEL